jgi:MinD-like ATPase involved in chromosome partitioning or flagellar assembly
VTSDRWVLLGLARPRRPWFAAVGRDATSGALAAEFLKCVSAEEVRVRLEGGRRCSAVLLDGGLPAVDRDLLAAVVASGAAAVVVDDGRADRDWLGLGATAVLPAGFERRELVEVLEASSRRVADAAALDEQAPAPVGHATLGRVAVVCGPGGTGASTAAAALAQGLGARGPSVVLADLALRAEQAVLHDVRDVVPGIQELVDAHRAGTPAAEEVRALTFDVVERRYALLLGLRRARSWSALRPAAISAALDSLRAAFDVVVADVTADFEGEADGGSVDVEERNALARTALATADVAVVVGRPGVKGLHALVRTVGDVVDAGLPAGRVVAVVADAPRSPRARAEIAAALASLASPVLPEPLPSPLFLPGRRVEAALRDARPLPSPLPERLAGAFAAVVARSGTRREAAATGPQRVAPGSLASWADPA